MAGPTRPTRARRPRAEAAEKIRTSRAAGGATSRIARPRRRSSSPPTRTSAARPWPATPDDFAPAAATSDRLAREAIRGNCSATTAATRSSRCPARECAAGESHALAAGDGAGRAPAAAGVRDRHQPGEVHRPPCRRDRACRSRSSAPATGATGLARQFDWRSSKPARRFRAAHFRRGGLGPVCRALRGVLAGPGAAGDRRRRVEFADDLKLFTHRGSAGRRSRRSRAIWRPATR